MKLKARCYNSGGGYLTECSEVGLFVRGSNLKETVKKMGSALKRHFNALFVSAEVDEDGFMFTLL